MTTTKLFANHNRKLKNSLIPSKERPIYGNVFFDPKDIAYDYSLKENNLN